MGSIESLERQGTAPKRRVPILLYHRISLDEEEADPLGLSVPPQQFKAQMRYLQKTRHVSISLEDLVCSLKDGKPIPPNAFVIAFDDGYEDTYLNAYPILMESGFSAMVFLVTELIGERSRWEGASGKAGAQLMSWRQIIEITREGKFDLGSHSRTHPYLTRLPRDQAKREIKESKQALEDKLDHPVKFFSYPYSDMNDHVMAMVRDSGYEAACGLNSGRSGIFNIWRIQCRGGDTWPIFRLKVSGWYEWPMWLRHHSFGAKLLKSLKRGISAAG